jgi:RHS repeat-associated protein
MIDSMSTESCTCRYQYDALDRLCAATQLSEATVQRFYQKNRLSIEIQGAMHRRVMQFDDHVLAEQRATETALPATDLQRSVLHSVDAQGQHDIAYSPYGHRPSGSDVFSLLGFAGERPDPVTGHYPLGNGYSSYNPVLMRFNQPDSLSPFGEGGLNAYAYCQGDPVNRSDPSGHVSVLQLLGMLGRRRSAVQLSPFELLPDLVHQNVVRDLSVKDLARLSQTSSRMSEQVLTLSRKTPKGYFEALTEVQIKDALQSPVGASPMGVKSEAAREINARIGALTDQSKELTGEIDSLYRADISKPLPPLVRLAIGQKLSAQRKTFIEKADALRNLIRDLRLDSE